MPVKAVWRRRVLGLGVLACLGTVGCSFRTMESAAGDTLVIPPPG
jgi:hypothetical protein